MGGEVNIAAAGTRPGRSLFAWTKRQGDGEVDARRANTRRMFSASRLITAIAILAMAATALSAGIGYELARQSDERLWTEQRASLRNAVAEFRTLFGQTEQVDQRFVRMIEQSTGLKGIKFESEPELNSREMQPVIGANGRIAGFFTWDKTHPAMTSMNRMMPLIVAVSIGLAGFAGFALWQLRRARRDLSLSEAQAANAADQDKLTGLPNHAKTLELLDLTLSERAANEVTTFALMRD